MPFKAACPFCPTKFKVSRKSLGASVRCPKCNNYFTAVPPDDEPPVSASTFRAPSARSAVSGAPAVSREKVENGTEDALSHGQNDLALPMAQSMPAPAGQKASGWVNIWGLAGFTLGSFGLLCASLSILNILTIPFAGLGLLVVLLGTLAGAEDRKNKDTVWLGLGALVGLAVLVVAVFWPQLLDPQRSIGNDVPALDLDKQLLVSPDNRVIGRELTETEWVDASKGAVKQGDVHIRVESAWIGAAPVKDWARDPATLKSLLIVVRVSNVGQLRRIPFEGVSSGKHVPILQDNLGKRYPHRDFGPEAVLAGQTRRAVLTQQKHVLDLLVFEPPPANFDHLKLEWPASAWGGKGSCKLRIPASMILTRKTDFDLP